MLCRSGGRAATVANIELRCRAHNAHEASLFVGAEEESNFSPVSPESG